MQQNNQNPNAPNHDQNYSHHELSDDSGYSDSENLDQMEEVDLGEDGMEMEEEENPDVYNSDADTFNTSSHPPVHLNHLETQYMFHHDAVLCLALNPVNRGEFVSGGMDDQIALWNINDETPVYSNKFSETVNNVAISYDGSLIACSVLDNKIKVFQRDENNQMIEKSTFTGFDDEISVN